MNPDNGEIRHFEKPEDIPEGWVPLTEKEADRLEALPMSERVKAVHQPLLPRRERRRLASIERRAAKHRR